MQSSSCQRSSEVERSVEARGGGGSIPPVGTMIGVAMAAKSTHGEPAWMSIKEWFWLQEDKDEAERKENGTNSNISKRGSIQDPISTSQVRTSIS